MITFLSYIFYFVASSASPLQKRWLAKKKDLDGKGRINLAFRTMCFLAVGSLFFPFFSPFYFSGNPWNLVFLSLVCGLVGMMNFILTFVAQKHVDTGVTSVVANINTPITIILASVLLHESLRGAQIVGTIFLLVGMFIVSRKHRVGRFSFDKYFLMMLCGGIMMGFLFVAERSLMKTTGFSAGVMFSWWSQSICLGLAVLISKSKNTYSTKDIGVSGTLQFLQSLSYVVLINIVGNLSIVSAVTTFKIVVIFIAAALFLHEREDWKRKLLGCIIALIGLLLMK
jgi:drug/metabolite transporter (DMT)-like permease